MVIAGIFHARPFARCPATASPLVQPTVHRIQKRSRGRGFGSSKNRANQTRVLVRTEQERHGSAGHSLRRHSTRLRLREEQVAATTKRWKQNYSSHVHRRNQGRREILPATTVATRSRSNKLRISPYR